MQIKKCLPQKHFLVLLHKIIGPKQTSWKLFKLVRHSVWQKDTSCQTKKFFVRQILVLCRTSWIFVSDIRTDKISISVRHLKFLSVKLTKLALFRNTAKISPDIAHDVHKRKNAIRPSLYAAASNEKCALHGLKWLSSGMYDEMRSSSNQPCVWWIGSTKVSGFMCMWIREGFLALCFRPFLWVQWNSSD